MVRYSIVCHTIITFLWVFFFFFLITLSVSILGKRPWKWCAVFITIILALLFVSQSPANPPEIPLIFSLVYFQNLINPQHPTTTLVHVVIIFLLDDFSSFLMIFSFTSLLTKKPEWISIFFFFQCKLSRFSPQLKPPVNSYFTQEKGPEFFTTACGALHGLTLAMSQTPITQGLCSQSSFLFSFTYVRLILVHLKRV